jgi:hypothetical protein
MEVWMDVHETILSLNSNDSKWLFLIQYLAEQGKIEPTQKMDLKNLIFKGDKRLEGILEIFEKNRDDKELLDSLNVLLLTNEEEDEESLDTDGGYFISWLFVHAVKKWQKKNPYSKAIVPSRFDLDLDIFPPFFVMNLIDILKRKTRLVKMVYCWY